MGGEKGVYRRLWLVYSDTCVDKDKFMFRVQMVCGALDDKPMIVMVISVCGDCG